MDGSLRSIEARNCESDRLGRGDDRAICRRDLRCRDAAGDSKMQGVGSPQRMIPLSLNEGQRIDGTRVIEQMTGQDALPQS